MKAASCVMVTHIKKENGLPLTPHLGAFALSNPDVALHVAVSPETGEAKEELWKNSDRFLRQWWNENRQRVLGDVVAIMEWDTLVTKAIPDLPEGLDMAFRWVVGSRSPIHSHQHPAKLLMESVKGPKQNVYGLNDRDFVMKGLSFGFFLVRREVLDALLESRWDAAFAQSIQNEIRTPTIAAKCGFRLGTIPLPHVRPGRVDVLNEPGIYHSVKFSSPA